MSFCPPSLVIQCFADEASSSVSSLLSTIPGSFLDKLQSQEFRSKVIKNLQDVLLRELQFTTDQDVKPKKTKRRKPEDDGQPKITCQKCGKRLVSESHTCERRHCCADCGKSFPYPHLLKLHSRVHSDFREFQCEYCGKKFVNPPSLNEHQKIHLGLKLFSCDFCTASFRSKSTLTVHIRSHTGERPYMCVQCGKKFRRHGHLSRHMAMHRGEKPHVCDVCGFRCSQKSDLKRHTKRHLIRNQLQEDSVLLYETYREPIPQ